MTLEEEVTLQSFDWINVPIESLESISESNYDDRELVTTGLEYKLSKAKEINLALTSELKELGFHNRWVLAIWIHSAKKCTRS